MIKKIISIIAFLFLLYGSILLIQATIPFLAFKPRVDFLISKQLVYHLDWWRISFYFHVFSSPVVILAGLIQFNKWSIHRYKKLHRITGYIYILVLLLFAAPSGFLIGLYANGSYPTQISFTILSALWLTTTILAWKTIQKGNVLAHTKWMIRSYALTLSAISLRFFTLVINYNQLPIHPQDAYILVSYSSWMINLIVAELLIWKGYPNYLMKK